jgi:hypothetical protein
VWFSGDGHLRSLVNAAGDQGAAALFSAAFFRILMSTVGVACARHLVSSFDVIRGRETMRHRYS